MALGCHLCFGEDAVRVLEGKADLDRIASLVEQSHFSVRLLRCRACQQAFASVFCETIDWVGGNDPQASLLVPLTAAEADTLRELGERAVARALLELPPRRHVHSYWASDAERADVRWTQGSIFWPPHD
ncbi:MAG: hypothetical protein JW940_25260 [Polyangiaceae bacterium]|nr:hypothetical protein [Polyangiaceae bacterium]